MLSRKSGGSPTGEMTLLSHLAEFRKRLVVCAVVFFIGMAVCLSYAETFCDILISRAPEFSFIYTSPTELFIVYIQLSILGGLILTVPMICYQIWRFLKPGLLRAERRAVILILTFGLLLFAAGAAFAFEAILPISIHFFWGLNEGKGVMPMMSISSYVNYVTGILFSFGIVFELPIAVVLLTGAGIIRARMLRQYRKYMILVIFTLAAVLTPPDVTSQILLAFPMLGLYEISIVLSEIAGRRADRAAEARVKALTGP